MSQKKVRKLTSQAENLLNPLIIIKHEKQTLPINVTILIIHIISYTKITLLELNLL